VRPKLVEGKLYFIRAYDVGKGGVPLETSHDYIVKFIERDSKSDWKVVILTTNQPYTEGYYSYPGIPWGEYDWRTSSFPVTSPYHRIFYMGEVRADDCMDVRKFKKKDAALCIGWPYVSNEILRMLQTA